jgi:hypothetical protein
MMTTQQVIVFGNLIQIDRSNGQGHNWQPADEMDCPSSIQEEIAAAIDEDDAIEYRGTNGIYYRW